MRTLKNKTHLVAPRVAVAEHRAAPVEPEESLILYTNTDMLLTSRNPEGVVERHPGRLAGRLSTRFRASRSLMLWEAAF